MVRIKHRYLLINILYPDGDRTSRQSGITLKDDLPWAIKFRTPTPDHFTVKQLVDLIRRGVQELFGEYGAGMIAASLIVKYFSTATNTAIIRVVRSHYRMVWSALTFVNQLPSGQACVIQVVRVSGTIRKSEEEVIRRAQLSIARAKASGGAPYLQLQQFQDQNHSAGIEDSDDDMHDTEDSDGD